MLRLRQGSAHPAGGRLRPSAAATQRRTAHAPDVVPHYLLDAPRGDGVSRDGRAAGDTGHRGRRAEDRAQQVQRQTE